MAEASTKTFKTVDIESLAAGMLVDRAIHVFLPRNERYIQLVKPMQQLEEATLEKIRKFGGAFTPDETVDEKFPQLATSAAEVRLLCDDGEPAPFEKNRRVREVTQWLYVQLLGPNPDVLAPVFFINRAFGVPRPETLMHVSDVSVESFDRGLQVASVACVLALWLGYTDSPFLEQFAQTVFCRELRSLENVPGVDKPDHRFRQLVGPAALGNVATDELVEVIEFARALVPRQPGVRVSMQTLRVARKIDRQFNKVFTKEAAA